MAKELHEGAIAVIGMALNVPGAQNLSEFWNNLRNGVESFGPLTDDELAEVGWDETIRQSPSWVAVRGFPKNPKEFDAAFFGIPPGDALLMDPQQRFLLECAQNAFDDAGYDPLAYEGDIGAWVGAGNSGYYSEFVEPAFRNQPQQQFNSVILNDFHYPATRLAHVLNFTGPVMNIATACSTGLVAAHYACQALRRHECDMALVGVSRINPGAYTGYAKLDGMMYSADGHCRVFDSRADGTVFTNGAAAVLLKRLDRAIEDRDNIRAIILGSAVNNDGNVKLSFTAPSSDGQEAVLEEAYRDADVDPATVTFVEGHGTATLLGDPIEVHALTRVFRRRTQKVGYCRLGSVKSNVGHLEVAAGVVGLIKAVLALENKEIPGTIHFTKPNPALDLEHSPFIVNAERQEWTCDIPRRAGVSSFGIGGTNAHLVLQEAAAVRAPATSRRKRHLLTISAKTEYSRDRAVENLASYFEQRPAELADVAYTLQQGRRAFPIRSAVACSSIADGIGRLRRGDVAKSDAPVRKGVGSIWMFSGQGSQYAGMARGLYEDEPVFRAVFDQCADVLLPQIGVDLRKWVFDSATPADEMEQTRLAQPALFAIEYSMASVLQAWGIEPIGLIGHSIGEYVAACVAGVFSLEDALMLVAARGALMQSLAPGAMIGVNCAAESLQDVLSAEVCLAAINSPEHCVISGPFAAIDRAAATLTGRGIVCRRLHTSHAFHSAMMDPILDQFSQRVREVQLNNPQLPFVSNVTGTWIEDSEATDPHYWSRHLRGTVKFAEGLATLCEFRPHDVLVELGPGTTLAQLAGLNSAASDHVRISLGRHSKGKREDGDVFLEGVGRMWVAGVDVDWSALYAGEERFKVSLPPYVFDREEFFFTQSDSRREGGRYEFHPLLGERQKSAVAKREIVFDATVSTFNPEFLLQHTIFGTPLIPATCYIDMALMVGKQILRTDAVKISDIFFQKPIPLPRGSECHLQTIVTRASDGALEMKVFSLPVSEVGRDDRAEEWDENVSARIEAAQGEPRDASADLANWKARLVKEIQLHEIYDPDRIDFKWGPAFQSVKRATCDDWEVLARIELPKSLEWEVRDFFLHPALLDGCFQLIGKAIPAEHLPGLMMPTAAERITVYGPAPTSFWGHVEASADRTNSQGVTVNIRLVGDDGREFARVDRFLELVATQTAVVQAGARVASWFHRIVWRVESLANFPRRAASPQLVLFADHDQLAERVAHAAVQAGMSRPILIYRDRLPAATGIDPFERIAASSANLGQLVPRLQQLNGQVMVASFWPLDSRATSDDPAVAMCDEMLNVVKALLDAAIKVARCFVITRGAQQVDAEPIANLDQSSLWGLQRVIGNEHPDLHCGSLDLDGAAVRDGQEVQSILNAAILSDSIENQICLRENRIYVARLARMERQQGWTKGPFAVRLSGYGTLDSLNVETLRPRKPGRGEILIAVQNSAVNFRDVLQAMGAMRAFNEAAGIYDPALVPIGFECGGTVLEIGEGVNGWEIGDRVLAFGHGCHTSHFTVDDKQVVRIPEEISIADAVALPTVLVTALYGLDRLAKLKKGDRVLIHSCAGGVGQAALRVARRAGATVFATASPSKWEFLRKEGVEHIWSSRNFDFVEGIKNATDGAGVDVVLNALNGEFIEKSLSVLAPGGRFVEIGKIGTWTKEQMAKARPDVQYFKFDLNEVSPKVFREILEEGLALVAQRILPTLPIRLFSIRNMTDAFRWIAQGQNIGKAVLEMPLATGDDAIKNTHTYLITGGLGGLGLIMAKGLMESGARHLALVGRSKPNSAAQAEIDKLRACGVNVRVLHYDVSCRADAESLFATIDREMPPLAGIMHAAGVLDDGVILKLDRSRLEKVFAPKVAGSRHLHELTKDRQLDFFVLFSSISAALGASGQGNYSAANAFMDMLAADRRANGLPGLSVGWGAWASAGMAAELVERFRVQRAAIGLRDIPSPEGIVAMNTLIDRGVAGHVVAVPVQWSRYLAQFLRSGNMPPLFAEFGSALKADANNSDGFSQEDVSFVTELRGADPATRQMLLVSFVTKQAAATVGAEAASINVTSTLAEIGVDSLIAMELRTRIGKSLGIQIPLTSLVGTVTVAEVAAKLADTFSGELQTAA